MNQFPSRKPTRLNNYDYSKVGNYYVTVCTLNHVELFGAVENDKMVLNQCGYVARKAWLDLPNHHNVELDEFIIMPNHIHGIITINNIHVGNRPACSVKIPACSVNKNNLSTIIGSYKSTVTKQINQINDITFKWQKSFYDHIIRNDHSIYKIREYIKTNPLNWDMDENNIKNNKLTVRAGPNPT